MPRNREKTKAHAGTEVRKNSDTARVGMPHFFVKYVKRVEQSAAPKAQILMAVSFLKVGQIASKKVEAKTKT